jgi:hypothetical protein
VCIQSTLVVVRTRHAVACVTGIACTQERTGRVDASGHTTRSTVVRVQVAFVVVSACDPATRVTKLTCTGE